MKVYKYNVYWQNYPVFQDNAWKQTVFARKADAKRFARKHKIRGIKPRPYIVRRITDSDFFKKGIELEEAKSKIDRKYIRY